jgi:hypothetical protein
MKAVLLHSGNKFPSVRLAYAVHTKETRTVGFCSIKCYVEHRWNTYADMKYSNADCAAALNVSGTAKQGTATTE